MVEVLVGWRGFSVDLLVQREACLLVDTETHLSAQIGQLSAPEEVVVALLHDQCVPAAVLKLYVRSARNWFRGRCFFAFRAVFLFLRVFCLLLAISGLFVRAEMCRIPHLAAPGDEAVLGLETLLECPDAHQNTRSRCSDPV